MAALLGVAHSYLGERLLLGPLFLRAELPAILGSTTFTRRTLRFAWHLTTALMVGIGLLIVAFASGPVDAHAVWILRYLSIVFAICGIVSLVGARGRHFSWYVFLAIAASVWLGSARG